MKTYLVTYLGSTFVALLVTPVVIWLAQRIGAVDVPDARKIHDQPVPRIGGIAIVVPTLVISLLVFLIPNAVGDLFRAIHTEILVLLGACVFMFLVGLVDDIRGIRARTKLLAQLAAAVAVCVVGGRITSMQIPGSVMLHFGLLSWPVTILWIVGITNAVNLADGLDGLAAGISAVACGTIAILAIYGQGPVMAILMLAMLGSLSGFLFYNFNPAKIFMGDCGSLFLGFTIGASSVLCATKSQTFVGLALPFLALGIPIFDTLFSMLRRFMERRSLFAPDRSHFHHKLLDLGLHQRHVVIIAYAVTVACVGFGMFMMVAQDIMGLLIFLCILLLLLLLFRAVGIVRLHNTLDSLKEKYATLKQTKAEIRAFEGVQLEIRRAETIEHFWKAICAGAEEMGFLWLSFRYVDDEDCEQTVVWRCSNERMPSPKAIVMSIPWPGNGNGLGHGGQFELALSASESVESVGRRASLFGRLLDERCHGGSIAEAADTHAEGPLVDDANALFN